MRRGQMGFKKRGLAWLLTAMLAVGSVFAPDASTLTVQAASYQHVKATQADFVQPNENNKKGVQGTEVAETENLADLSLNHIMLNVDLTQVISTNGTGTPYTYNGKTYYFNEQEGSYMKVWQARVKEYRDQGITMTFCLVMSWSDNAQVQKLMYNPTPGKVYYALNVTNSEAREEIAALLHFMANRFGYSDTFVQNWRVGNEVNVSHDYNYTGAGTNNIPLKSTLVTLATQSYDLLEKALEDENPYARAFVSVTHDWNYANEGKGVPTREFIDSFAAATTTANWNLDFHAYPPKMNEQVWTKQSASYLTHDVMTNTVCAPNLEVLTDYVKNTYGTNHRIALSEQSFDSAAGEEEQAAMIAYTYYAAARNDMIDNVIFTTWKDTNSVYHDFYNMGMVDIYGNKKAAYNVFKYMNTSQASTYVDPYLAKLSAWTGRTISSWSDDILYKTPATTATLASGSLYMPADQQTVDMVYIGMTTSPTNKEVDLEYMWTAYNYTNGKTTVLTGWNLNNEWLKWYPDENATYKLTCTARVAGNTASQITVSQDQIVVNIPGKPNTSTDEITVVGKFASYNGYDFYRDAAGNITCQDGAGNLVINQFMCDGTYTYYFQFDGTAMRNRLTYHPDGEHVIYFNENCHEVFDNFAYVKQSIAGTPVDDMCYFDTFGYMYVDFMTYDISGTFLYYANPYGVVERNGWFQFSDGGVGYANADGTLMVSQFTYDQWGRVVYVQGNGHLAKGLISDGVYWYQMDDTDGHFIGKFLVN